MAASLEAFEREEQQRKNIDAVLEYTRHMPDDQDNPAAFAALHAHHQRVALLREQGITFRSELLYNQRGATACWRVAAFDRDRLKIVEKFWRHDGGPQEGEEMTEAQALRLRNRDGKIMAGW